LIRSAIAIIVFMVIAFSFYDFIFDDVIMGPKNADFWTYRLMCRIADWLNTPDFCVTEVPGTIINTQMAGQFILQINSSLIIAVMLGFPYLLYEVWLFIKPALTDIERKSASGFVFYASLLFVLGVLFGYFVVVLLAMNFLANDSISGYIAITITVQICLPFAATLTRGCGIIFDLPIIIFILSKLGIMTPQFMRKSRQYAVVIILIIAAIITPTPDIITMLTVSFPMFLLYELSIVVASRVHKNRMKAEAEFYNNEEKQTGDKQ